MNRLKDDGTCLMHHHVCTPLGMSVTDLIWNPHLLTRHTRLFIIHHQEGHRPDCHRLAITTGFHLLPVCVNLHLLQLILDSIRRDQRPACSQGQPTLGYALAYKQICCLFHCIHSGSFFFKALGITLLFMAGFPDDLVQRETKYRNLDLLQKYYSFSLLFYIHMVMVSSSSSSSSGSDSDSQVPIASHKSSRIKSRKPKSQSLSENLASAGQPIIEAELISLILGGLGMEYDVVVVNVTGRQGEISLQEVQYQLMSYESRLAKHNNPISLDMNNVSAQYAFNGNF
ncbi:hypothetical protein LWI28_027040 [Acer negundo]|uniref:Uncharacterized protein n=1 Tax=Acer negundo TaxID=4023 RepID=A0AAD5JG81_ACENE|nr:hypothetical protein LWI28_027040 [Acer negundo]